MTLSRQQVTKVLLLMMILQAVHLLITEQPVVEGLLIRSHGATRGRGVTCGCGSIRGCGATRG